MRYFKQTILFIFNKFIRRMSTGRSMYIFCKNMGIAYIKLAQILSMWNIDGIFSEQDRVDIKNICDECKTASIREIKNIIYESYNGKPLFIKKIYKKPLGSASVSQVHKAILINGDNVVLKIKRRDIEKTIHRDIKIIKLIVNKFGYLFGFTNKTGTTMALQMYEEWLSYEIDFKREVKNIIDYTEFAHSVNGKVRNCVDIVVPTVYEQYCTDDIIVMQYIPYKTLNNGNYNQKDVRHAIDSYIKLSFYALLHKTPVYFHGDPHLGNLYLDNKGNIGFLDMGLIFSLSKDEAADTIDFFMSAFYADSSRLYEKLKNCITGSEVEKKKFYNELKEYCNTIKDKAIANYFVDLMVICFKYNIVPPQYLFKMAKAFVYIGGAEILYTSDSTGYELLGAQVLRYLGLEFEESLKQINYNIVKSVDSLLQSDLDKAAPYSYKAIKETKKIKGIIDKAIKIFDIVS